MTLEPSTVGTPIVFTDFERDVARRPEIQAQLEDVARHTADWSAVRRFCIRHEIAFRET